MQKFRLVLAGLCVLAMLLSVTVVQAAPQNANFAGTWELTMTGGRQGGGGEQEEAKRKAKEADTEVAEARNRSLSRRTATN